MTAIPSQIPLVDRKHELEELKNHLSNAVEGQGNLLFIAGEAGVGKTRLVEELKTYAQSQGIQVLQGWSLYESLTPYMPFVEALRSANLEYLFSREDPPKVDCVYLITDVGLLIREVVREETKLDSTIFAGMLTAVGEFVKDSLSMLSGEEKNETLNSLGYENYRILIESGKNTNLVVILTGRENEFLVNDMKEVLVNVEKDYGDVLKAWDGDDNSVKGIDKLIKPLITSGKYDGIDYAKDEPHIKRNRLFENVLLGIERHTKVNPSLLCIEDLQWADPSTLALMHYVARNTRKCNLLILGTYRPEDVSTTKDGEAHPLIEAMQMMSREDLYQKIKLNRLKEEYMDKILTSILGDIDFTDEFKKYLYNETEGNPFFIVSLIQMLIKENTIRKKDDAWIFTKEIREANIPSKIQDVITRRLNRVDKENRDILEYAAIIGEEFSSELLGQATQYDRIELLKRLRNLEQNHKLIKSIDLKYKFDHAKIKEILYSQIPAELRTEYHEIIAHSIETKNKDNLDDVIGDLAFHYYRSKVKEKALPYLIIAAEKAKNTYSNEEAIIFYNQIIELEKNPQKRIDGFHSLGDMYTLIGNFKKSIKSYEYALELIEDKKTFAEIKAKIGRIHERIGDYDESIKLCNEAIELVKEEKCYGKALALLNIGIVEFRRGELNRAIKQYQRSLEIGTKIGDNDCISQSFNWIGNIYMIEGEYDEALKHYQKSLVISEKTGNQKGIVTLLMNIGIICHCKGDYGRALEYFNRSLRKSEKIGSHYDMGNCYHNMGHMFTDIEELDKARDCLEKSLKISERDNEKVLSLHNYCHLAIVYLKKGDIKTAIDFCTRALTLSEEFHNKWYMGITKRVFGMIFREQERWNKSIENFDESINIFKEGNMKHELGDSYYEYGLMWKDKGDLKKAREYLNNALEIYKKMDLDYYIKRVEKELQACQ